MAESFHVSTMIKWIFRGVRQEHILKIVEAPYPVAPTEAAQSRRPLRLSHASITNEMPIMHGGELERAWTRIGLRR